MTFKHWLEDAHVRIFPFGNTTGSDQLELDVARGERISFQAAVEYQKQADEQPPCVVAAEASAEGGPLKVRTRRVGFVPVAHFNTDVPDDEKDCIGHIPGFVPDPLFDDVKTLLRQGETVAFWFTVDIPEACEAGDY